MQEMKCLTLKIFPWGALPDPAPNVELNLPSKLLFF